MATVRDTHNDHILVHSTSVASGVYSVTRVFYFVVNVVETILAARFLLRLLGANTSTPFVNFVYTLSDPLVAPFRGIFSSLIREGTVVEWSTLAGMIVYALVGYAVVRLVMVLATHDDIESLE